MVIFIMKKKKKKELMKYICYITLSIFEIWEISGEVPHSSWNTNAYLFNNLTEELIKFWNLHIHF